MKTMVIAVDKEYGMVAYVVDHDCEHCAPTCVVAWFLVCQEATFVF